MRNNVLFTLLISLCCLSLGTYLKKEIDSSNPGRPEELSRDGAIIPNQVVLPVSKEAQLLRENLFLQETQSLKEEVSRLRTELLEQKNLTSKLLERTNELINSQNQLNTQFTDTLNTLTNINTDTKTLRQLWNFRDIFILDKEGKTFAYVDDNLRIYEYGGGNFIGWIKPDTNEIIRNFDNSIVAIIENDFVIDETGHPVGSLERSETLRWDREKLYGKVQKTPASHFFNRPASPRQFILSSFRSSDWSTQKIEDVLFFSEKRIQKLK